MAAEDLTTIGAVRAFLQKPAADVSQDAEIAVLITAASRAIMRWTSREFAPSVSAVARDFEYDGGGVLWFGVYDLRSVTSVQIDALEASPTTLTTDEYRLYPVPARDGVYGALRLDPTLLHSRARWNQRIVRVTGDWGFATVPADVAQACVVTVAIWLRRDVQGFVTTFNIDEQRTEVPEALPAQAARMLTPWRREVYV